MKPVWIWIDTDAALGWIVVAVYHHGWSVLHRADSPEAARAWLRANPQMTEHGVFPRA